MPAPPDPRRRLSRTEEALLERFRERLLSRAPAGSVRQIVVFGSRARGESNEHSDLDVAVLVSVDADLQALRDLSVRAGWEVSDELDVHEAGLAPVALPESPWQPLFGPIARDGVRVWPPPPA